MRNPKRDEMVIMGTCQQTKRPFGITVEKQGKDYVFTWAFKINAKAAKREGFEKNKVSGQRNILVALIAVHRHGFNAGSASGLYACRMTKK